MDYGVDFPRRVWLHLLSDNLAFLIPYFDAKRAGARARGDDRSVFPPRATKCL